MKVLFFAKSFLVEVNGKVDITFSKSHQSIHPVPQKNNFSKCKIDPIKEEEVLQEFKIFLKNYENYLSMVNTPFV